MIVKGDDSFNGVGTMSCSNLLLRVLRRRVDCIPLSTVNGAGLGRGVWWRDRCSGKKSGGRSVIEGE